MGVSGRGCGRLQTLLFSATLHTPEVRALAERITQRPTFVDLKGKDAVPETELPEVDVPPELVGEEWILLEHPVDQTDLASGTGQVDHRLAKCVELFQVGAGIDQQLNQAGSPVDHRHVERRLAPVWT